MHILKRKRVKVKEYTAPDHLEQQVLNNFTKLKPLPRWLLRMLPSRWFKRQR